MTTLVMLYLKYDSISIAKKSNKTLCLWQESFYEKEDLMRAFAVNISPQEESLKRFKRQLFHRFLITPVPGENWWVLFQ